MEALTSVEPENVSALIFVLLGTGLRLVGESIVDSLVKRLGDYVQPNVTVNADIKIQNHFSFPESCSL